MRIGRLPRPTVIETVLALLFLAESVVELLGDAQGTGSPTVRVAVGVSAPVAVAFSRTAPRAAAAVLVLAWLLDSFPGPAEGTLGAGFSMLAIVFALAAWSNRPWPWLAAILGAGTIRDLRMFDADPLDMVIDWAFVVIGVLAGLAVHRRTARADRLAGQLEITRAQQKERAADAVARERATIARELHDIVAHSVSLMVVQAGTAGPLAARHDAELAEVLVTIETTGRQALDELRRLLAVLRSEESDDLAPLPDLAALPALVERVRSAGLVVVLHVDGDLVLPASTALCAYRVVQEGLTNALRHREGGRTEVVLTGSETSLTVRVSTRGGRARASEDGSGTGLLGLRERVLLSDGELHCGPQGDDWEVVAVLPLDPLSRPHAGGAPVPEARS